MSDVDEKAKDFKGGKVPLSFYDATTLAPLSPAAETEIEIQTVWGKSLGYVKLQKNDDKSSYLIDLCDIDLSQVVPPADPNQDEEAGLEIPCGVPRAGSPQIVIGNFKEPVALNCNPIQTVPTAADFMQEGTEPCSPVPIGVITLEESYPFGIVAHDSCISDYISNPKALIDDVRLEVREVQTQKPASGSTTKFRGRSFSATTKQGYAEITGLTYRQLHEVQIVAPPGYVSASPIAPHLMHCSGGSVLWQVAFKPCGEFPDRSVIFVRQECPGMRLPNLPFQALGGSQNADPNGLWNIPSTLTSGTIDFQSQGKVFSPAKIELGKNTPMISIVEVADQPVAQLTSGKRRFRFVDEKGEPFAHRQLRLVSQSGHEERVRADHDGWFEAEEGSRAWADDDASGHSVDGIPLWTSEYK